MTELPPIGGVGGWPAGSTDYPALVDEFDTQLDGQFAKDINDVTASIKAIELILGTNPSAGHPSVRAALVNLQSALSSVQSSHLDLAAQVSSLSATPGPPNSFYRHVQTSPASIWTITHPLGRRPAVTIVDSAGTPVEGDVDYPSTSVVVASFSAPFAGEALLS